MYPTARRLRACPLIIACAAGLLSACASTPRQSGPSDPLEPLNRQVYAFNDVFDRNIARPVARGYKKATPTLVQQGIGNFFSNIDDVAVLFNSMLQLKGRKSAATAFRLGFNSTIGLFGLVDVAGAFGVNKENEDFGQTLGHWGLGPGPYLVLPFLGPSDVRDTGGRVVDGQYDALSRVIEDNPEYYGAVVLNAIDTRARLLGATGVLDTAAIDPYRFTRDAFLKRRANLVHDGNPPPEALPDEDPAPGGDGEAFDPFSDEDDDLFKEDGSGDETTPSAQ